MKARGLTKGIEKFNNVKISYVFTRRFCFIMTHLASITLETAVLKKKTEKITYENLRKIQDNLL
jgi:hypothetical protein